MLGISGYIFSRFCPMRVLCWISISCRLFSKALSRGISKLASLELRYMSNINKHTDFQASPSVQRSFRNNPREIIILRIRSLNEPVVHVLTGQPCECEHSKSGRDPWCDVRWVLRYISRKERLAILCIHGFIGMVKDVGHIRSIDGDPRSIRVSGR